MKGRQDKRDIKSFQLNVSSTGPDITANNGYPETIDFTFEMDSLTRSYPPTINAIPAELQKSRPYPTPKIIYVVAQPPKYRRVRQKVGGKGWRYVYKPIKVPKTIFVYPKRVGPKKNKNKKKFKRAPNPLSTVSWKVTKAESASWSGQKESYDGTGVYVNTVSGRLGLHPVPFGPFRGSGDHRPDFMSIAVQKEAELHDELYYKLIGDFHDDLKDQSINFAQALAERAQTADLILGAAKKAASILLSLKNGRIGKAAKELSGIISPKEISNSWLVYQYGVKPLLSDAEGMAEHLAKSLEDLPKVSPKKSKFNKSQFDETYEFNSGGVAGHAQLSISTEYAMKIGCDVFFDSPRLTQMKQLGVVNVLSLGYELIPFSFVADWFLPIGDFLNRLDSTWDLKPQQIYVTKFFKQKIKLTLTPAGKDDNGHEWSGDPVTTEIERTSMVRDTPLSIPPPPLPRFKNPFSLVHIANAAALFDQLKKR